MDNKIKTWVGTVILIIIAVTAGAFIWVAQKNSTIDELVAVSSAVPVKKQAPAATAAPAQSMQESKSAVYDNEQYGFEMTFPSAWDYKVTPHYAQYGNGFDFSLSSDMLKSDPKLLANNFGGDPFVQLFTVYYVDIKDWNNCINKAKSENINCGSLDNYQPGSMLSKSDKYVFFYSFIPGEISGFPSDVYAKLKQDWDSIKNSFKILN
jgi:hypothetical protein